MKSIYIFHLFIIILLFIDIYKCTTTTPSYIPYHIHLALDERVEDMMVSWSTKDRIPLPTVYYFQGSCNEMLKKHNHIKDNSKLIHQESLREEEEELTSMVTGGLVSGVISKQLDLVKPFYKVAIGSTSTYYEYDGFIHSVKLTKLLRGKQYCYRVGGEANMWNVSSKYATSWSRHWNSFKTSPLADTPTIIGAFADSGTWGDVGQVFKFIASDPDITAVIHAGDLSYGLTEEVWDTFGTLIEPISASFPYMVIPGNWDVKDGALNPYKYRYKMPLEYESTIDLEEINDSTTTISQSSNNNNNKVSTFKSKRSNNLFYSFEYSHVYMIMMSSYDDYDRSSLQYEWLVEQLKYADNIRHRVPWIIVCVHSPMYSSSQGHDGSDLVFRKEIEPLFAKYQVNLVISGHDHGYERTFPVFDGAILNHGRQEYQAQDGTIHILAGTGGATSDPWMEQPDWSIHRETSWGFTKIRAFVHTLEVTYLRINGTTGDHFTIFNSRSNSTSHTSIVFLLLLLAIIIFPFCACKGLPNKLFLTILQNDPYQKKIIV